MIKGSIYLKNITILAVYASNNWASKYIRKKLIKMKGEMEKSWVTVRDINILLSVIDGRNRKICKDTENLKTIVTQLDLIDIYGTLHPTALE